MVKHTQTIRQQQPTNCLSMFDHFVELAFKRLMGLRNACRIWSGIGNLEVTYFRLLLCALRWLLWELGIVFWRSSIPLQIFLKAVFHKFYLGHSWIICRTWKYKSIWKARRRFSAISHQITFESFSLSVLKCFKFPCKQ